MHIAHLKGPPKNYLKSVMLAALTVFVMYLLGSIAISVAVPDKTLELTSGASQAFTVYADGFGIPGLSNVLSGLLVLGALAASIAWIAGPSRSMWLVGKAGYLPRGLQKTNKNDVQMPLLLLQGAVVTVLSFVFVVAPNTSEAFAMLQDVSISLYMLMYVCMFAAAIKLRRSQPDRERPIKIPVPPGDRRRRHPVGGLGDHPRSDTAGRLLEPVAGNVRGDHRRRRHRAGDPTAVHPPLPQAVVVERDPSPRRSRNSPTTTESELAQTKSIEAPHQVTSRNRVGGAAAKRSTARFGGSRVRGPGGRRGCSTWPAATPLRRRR